MKKIWLIIKREYLTRVRNKTFILSTILTPLLFVGLITAVTFISVKNVDKETVAVVDKANLFNGKIENAKAITFSFPQGVDSTNYQQKGFSAVLYVPTDSSNKYRLISKKQFGMIAEDNVEDKINAAMENNMLRNTYNIDMQSNWTVPVKVQRRHSLTRHITKGRHYKKRQ